MVLCRSGLGLVSCLSYDDNFLGNIPHTGNTKGSTLHLSQNHACCVGFSSTVHVVYRPLLDYTMPPSPNGEG